MLRLDKNTKNRYLKYQRSLSLSLEKNKSPKLTRTKRSVVRPIYPFWLVCSPRRKAASMERELTTVSSSFILYCGLFFPRVISSKSWIIQNATRWPTAHVRATANPGKRRARGPADRIQLIHREAEAERETSVRGPKEKKSQDLMLANCWPEQNQKTNSEHKQRSPCRNKIT